MTARRLVLAGGTVTVAAIGVVRRYRRPAPSHHSRSHLAAPVALPIVGTLVMPGLYDWDLGKFAGQIWGIFGVVWDQVKDAVFAVVGAAVDVVLAIVNRIEAATNWTLNALGEGIKYVTGEIADISHAVGGVIVETYNRVEGAFQNFREQLKAFLETAWDDLKDWVIDNFPDWIGGFFGDIWDILTALGGIGMDGVRFLINLVDDPIGFLWALLRDNIDNAIAAALTPAEFLFDYFWQMFWITLQTVLGIPENPLDVLKGAWWAIQMAYYLATGNIDKIAKDLLPDAVDYFEREIRRLIGEEQFKIEQWVGMAQGVGHATDGAIQ